jgi:ankyrin repeat protein
VKSPIQFRVTFIVLALACTTIAVSCHRNEAQGNRICDAAGKGDLATVESLLKGNPKLVLSKDDKSDTPLHLAASHGYRDVVALLLASKADVNARTEQR